METLPMVNLKNKELYKIDNFLLKFLSVLTSFTTELECLHDEIPFKNLEVFSKSILQDIVQNETPQQTDMENSVDTIFEVISPPTEFEIASQISYESPICNNPLIRTGLENVRKTVKLIGERVGLTNQNFSNMQDYYAKHSTLVVNDGQVPSSSRCLSIGPDQYDSESDQIPEKDINPTFNVTHSVPSENPFTSDIDSDAYEHLHFNNMQLSNSIEPIHQINNMKPTSSTNCCTSIEKINNLMQSKARKPLCEMKALQLPDLTLKPITFEDSVNNLPHSSEMVKKSRKKCKSNLKNFGMIF